MASLIAVVDTGPLYAAADGDDAAHDKALQVLTQGMHLLIPALVVAETTYLIGTRMGPGPEARFLSGLRELDVQAPLPDDWTRIAELVQKYADFPLGGTDASVVAAAERVNTPFVITLDRRQN